MNIETTEVEGWDVTIHDVDQREANLLTEAIIRGTHLVGTYSYDKHQPHNPTGDYHLHVYKKGNQIFSINKNGRGHDGYSGTEIPNNVFKALKNKFPDWNWPENQIIESQEYKLFLNSNSSRNHLRMVSVSRYKDHMGKDHEGFTGYFHTFGHDAFLTGGNGGWKEILVAIVEEENGSVRKVPVNAFKFTDL